MSLTSSANRVVCDRYRLTDVLGKGGMGVVWRARDERLQRDVAIKEVELPASVPPQARAGANERALREARAAARMSHPAAVTIFDVQQESGRVYLVMELVDSPSLSEILERQGTLSPEETARIGADVLDALEAAHAVGIVHRDVKPANVMVPPEGTAKLADFGIASLKDDPKITQTGLILGSPSFMAPEQAGGTSSGPEADLWALGATMYYAVEGQPPFDEGQAIPTLAAVLHDEPRPMQRAGSLAPAISALLAKDPHQRPSYSHLRAMLQDAAAGRAPQPMSAPATSARTALVAPARDEQELYEPAPAPNRRRAGVAAAVVALLLVLGAGGLAFMGGNEESSEPTRDAPVAEKKNASENSNKGPGGAAEDPADSSDPGSTAEETTEESDVVTSSEAAAPPEGWTLYEDPTTGYSIAYPEGWTIETVSSNSTDFSDPASGAYLRVAWRSPPGPSAVGAWEEYEPDFASRHEGYQRIVIEPTTFRGYEAATWEFTWEEGGTTIHAIDLGFIVGDDYGFALNFVAPESEWADFQDEFQVFQETYSPPT
ncbi:MAG: serine/threonine protein kinase [Actinomycetota bacterium]|nr:serine/threonine protein kinase [Actinomycetota bacterium]